jgi:uncharacterized membrane protein YjjP (DUF1212 family)
MTGLLMKLFICPTLVLLSDLLFRGINYSNIYQPVTVGLFLALAAHISELFSLGRVSIWINNTIDFIAAFAIIYISQFYYTGSRITFTGAFLAAVILTISEYFQHSYLIRSGLVRKA